MGSVPNKRMGLADKELRWVCTKWPYPVFNVFCRMKSGNSPFFFSFWVGERPIGLLSLSDSKKEEEISLGCGVKTASKQNLWNSFAFGRPCVQNPVLGQVIVETTKKKVSEGFKTFCSRWSVRSSLPPQDPRPKTPPKKNKKQKKQKAEQWGSFEVMLHYFFTPPLFFLSFFWHIFIIFFYLYFAKSCFFFIFCLFSMMSKHEARSSSFLFYFFFCMIFFSLSFHFSYAQKEDTAGCHVKRTYKNKAKELRCE